MLHLSNALSIQLATGLAGCTALGRLGAGLVLKRMHWYTLLLACVLATLALWYRSQGSVAVGSVTTPR